MRLLKVKTLLKLFKEAFQTLSKNDPLRLGAATAFFTIFALPPILIILSSLLGFIFSEQIVSGELFERLKAIIGSDSARQVFKILENILEMNKNWWITIGGFIFLIFISTTLFKVISDSLNQLWKIKLKKGSSLKNLLKTRLKSFTIILFGGILFLASLLMDAGLAYAKDYIVEEIPQLDNTLIQVARRLVTFAILTVWISTIFKFLADAIILWKPIRFGAVVTAILFTIGEVILGKLLVSSGLDSIYGAAGAIVLMLLFVFYSSFIFYFGASLTKCYADEIGKPIKPKHYATKYKIQEF